MGIEAISHEAISIYIYIFYIYTYTKPCIGWKNPGYKHFANFTQIQPLADQRTSISSEVRLSRKHLNLAWGWSNIKNVFLVFKKFQPIILKSTTFLHFSQNASRMLSWQMLDLSPFLFHTSSYYQHKQCKNDKKSLIFTIQFASNLIPPKWVVTFNLSTCGAVETGSGSGLRSPGCWIF